MGRNELSHESLQLAEAHSRVVLGHGFCDVGVSISRETQVTDFAWF